MLCRTCRKLPRALVECDSFELEVLVDIDSLQYVIGPVEDYERVARNIGLWFIRQP
jgi:hypothetical protein